MLEPSMKPVIKKKTNVDQTIEIVICFVISFVLIYLFLRKPESAMTKAVVENDRDKIQQIIRESKDLDEPGPCRQTRSLHSSPLIQAAWLDRKDMVVEILNAGANVNARDEYGTTPLLAALSRGDVQTSIVLLERGADPNLATCLGHGSCTTALRCARRLNDAQLINKIESVGGREDTPWFFPVECFWMNMRPVALMTLTRIVPLVILVMLTGSLLRRRFGRPEGPDTRAI
jgi:hypothetical protein